MTAATGSTTSPAGNDPLTPSIVVTPGPDRSLHVEVRDHRLVTDQRRDDQAPGRAPGQAPEHGPEPIELFVAGLTACVATYAAAYLRRHGMGTAGLEVTGAFSLGDRPARVTEITIRLTPPAHLREDRRQPMLAMARHCTAHNTFLKPPVIDIDWA